MSLEQAVHAFAVLGGIESQKVVGYFDDRFEMVESTIVAEYEAFELLISPSYLLESPYLEILIAVARGDGKLYSVLRKAKLSEVVGLESVGFLCEKGVLSLESSRQAPL